MAGVHNALTRGPWTAALKAVLGDSKAEGGVERYSETMQPVIDLWSRPEFAFKRRERLMGAPFDTLSAAGTIPEILLFNPPGRILAVISHLRWNWQVTIGALADMRLFRGAALPAGFVTVNSGPVDTRDPQLIAAPASGVIAAQAANVARSGGLPFDTMFLAVQVPQDLVMPIVLAPGTGLTFGSTAVGVQRIIASARWYERVAFNSELIA